MIILSRIIIMTIIVIVLLFTYHILADTGRETESLPPGEPGQNRTITEKVDDAVREDNLKTEQYGGRLPDGRLKAGRFYQPGEGYLPETRFSRPPIGPPLNELEKKQETEGK